MFRIISIVVILLGILSCGISVQAQLAQEVAPTDSATPNATLNNAPNKPPSGKALYSSRTRSPSPIKVPVAVLPGPVFSGGPGIVFGEPCLAPVEPYQSSQHSQLSQRNQPIKIGQSFVSPQPIATIIPEPPQNKFPPIAPPPPSEDATITQNFDSNQFGVNNFDTFPKFDAQNTDRPKIDRLESISVETLAMRSGAETSAQTSAQKTFDVPDVKSSAKSEHNVAQSLENMMQYPSPVDNFADKLYGKLAKIQLERHNIAETLNLIGKMESDQNKVETLVDFAEYVSRDKNYRSESDILFELSLAGIAAVKQSEPVLLAIPKTKQAVSVPSANKTLPTIPKIAPFTSPSTPPSIETPKNESVMILEEEIIDLRPKVDPKEERIPPSVISARPAQETKTGLPQNGKIEENSSNLEQRLNFPEPNKSGESQVKPKRPPILLDEPTLAPPEEQKADTKADTKVDATSPVTKAEEASEETIKSQETMNSLIDDTPKPTKRPMPARTIKLEEK